MSFTQKLIESPWRTAICLICIGVLGGAIVKAINAWNARLTPEAIAAGKVLFEREWTANDVLCGDGDGLGPVFNANSCVACHFQGGVGGSGNSVIGSVDAFTVVPHQENDDFIFGTIHADAIDDSDLETGKSLAQKYPSRDGGTRNIGGCVVQLPDFNPVIFDKIDSPALFGIGELDKVSNMAIAFHNAKRLAGKVAKELDGNFSSNGVGKSRKLSGGRIGKFGWKAQFASLEDFVASACANELGLTNHLVSQTIPNQFTKDDTATPDMTRQQLYELVSFIRSLPVPKQILPDDPELRERALDGETIFAEIGCSDCHVKNFGHLDGVFSDFHLYRLTPPETRGSGYGIPDPVLASFPEEIADPDEWRTPPLWGVADSAPYMHDGRARTLAAAIADHRGHANHSRELFAELDRDSQAKLIEFLETLKAPVMD